MDSHSKTKEDSSITLVIPSRPKKGESKVTQIPAEVVSLMREVEEEVNRIEVKWPLKEAEVEVGLIEDEASKEIARIWITFREVEDKVIKVEVASCNPNKRINL